MRILPPSAVTAWMNVVNVWTPRSLDTNCPFCRRIVNFTLGKHNWDLVRKTMAATAPCPGCDEQVSIWIVDPSPVADSTKKGAACIAIFPGNQDNHEPIEGSEHIPETIRLAYNEAVQVYNAKIWSATTTLCRRTLEGMVMHLTGQQSGSKPLAHMLKELPSKVDLGRPIVSLADSVRLGGNIGAHFDVETAPDAELAKTMLELLEYLLEYFYTIPKQIESAKAVLDKKA